MIIYDGPDFKSLFSKVSNWTVFNKYFIPATYLMQLISFDFSAKVHVKYLEAKYWTYWTVFDKHFIPGPYLMEPISCEFFQRSSSNKQYHQKLKHCYLGWNK